MGRPHVDLIGQRFGKLVVEELIGHTKNHGVIWKCKCDCGNEVDVLAACLTGNRKTSCGCDTIERIRQSRIKSNTYDLSGDYGIGYTSKGEEFYFDLEDYELIKDYCWRMHNGYLDAKVRDGSNKRILMHCLIMGHKYVDHIGGNKNDNRKSNLRIPPKKYKFHTYNNMNKRIQSNNTSGCPGVYYCKDRCKWRVSISVNNRCIDLGSYSTFDEAVRVRKEAEEKYFGEYSYGNSQIAYQELIAN